MKNLNKRFIYHNCVMEEDSVWLWDINFNALFCCDKEKRNAKRLTIFHQSKEQLGAQYNKIAKYHDKIIAVPALAENILIYDIKTGQTRYVDIKISGVDSGHGKFWDIICAGKFAFLIGYYVPCVLKLNMEEEIVENCIFLYEQDMAVKSTVYFKFGCLDGDIVLIPSCIENVIYEMNIYSMKYKKITLDNVVGGFNAICKVGNDYWLAPRYAGSFVKWSREHCMVQCYSVEIEDFDFSLSPTIGFLQYDGSRIWAFPLKASKILKINAHTGAIEIERDINSYYNSLDIKEDIQKYAYVSMKDEKLYVHTWGSRELICYDINSGKLIAESYAISDKDNRKYIWQSIKEENVRETDSFQLYDFIDVLIEPDENCVGNYERVENKRVDE